MSVFKKQKSDIMIFIEWRNLYNAIRYKKCE